MVQAVSQRPLFFARFSNFSAKPTAKSKKAARAISNPSQSRLRQLEDASRQGLLAAGVPATHPAWLRLERRNYTLAELGHEFLDSPRSWEYINAVWDVQSQRFRNGTAEDAS